MDELCNLLPANDWVTAQSAEPRSDGKGGLSDGPIGQPRTLCQRARHGFHVVARGLDEQGLATPRGRGGLAAVGSLVRFL